MKGYLGIFRMRLLAGLQYRAAAWAGVATQFFWGFIQLLVFAAFYRSSNSEPPMPFAQLADYIWLRQAFLALLMLWAQDNELLEHIVSGHVAYELCRPYRVYSFWFSRLVATRIAKTALRCGPILCFTLFLPEPYRLHFPADPGTMLCFVLALALALTLVAAVSMFIYLLTFIFLSANGVRLFIGVIGEFLMGALIPVPLMPEKLQRIVTLLPFRYMGDFPFRVYSGGITGTDIWAGMAIQAGWAVVLIVAGLAGFRAMHTRIVVQGG